MKHLPLLLLLLPLQLLFSCDKGSPPVADFTITPDAGNTGTNFIIDPTLTTDAENEAEDLRFRQRLVAPSRNLE
jgi:hypothetical protein